MNQRETDEKVLERFGWSVDCWSPFEVSHEESNSFARGMAATLVLCDCHEQASEEDAEAGWQSYERERA